MGHFYRVVGGANQGLIAMRLTPLWKPGLLWLMLLGPLFFITYSWANHWAAAQVHVPSIVFGWEKYIPFFPWTILPYWSIDFFYALSLLVCVNRLELQRHALRLLSAQIICVVSFVLFPLHFSTPRPAVEGWAGILFNTLASFDLPFNQAPSLHIVLLLILWDFYRRRLRGLVKSFCHAWSALIAVSVLTTYQHHFIDVPTGLLAGVICLWLWPLEADRPHWEWTQCRTRRTLALIYGCSALLLTLLAGVGRAWWVLYWPATALALVALCYAGYGASGMQKRSHGRHSLATRLILWPYRLFAWLNARYWTRSLATSHQISTSVWLGRLPLPWEKDHRRFKQIVDLTCELALHRPGVQSHGWLDLTPPTPEQLQKAVAVVQDAALQGPVLVCCALGFSRSAAVVLTWLCLHGGKANLNEALLALLSVRPQIVLKTSWLKIIEHTITTARTSS